MESTYYQTLRFNLLSEPQIIFLGIGQVVMPAISSLVPPIKLTDNFFKDIKSK